MSTKNNTPKEMSPEQLAAENEALKKQLAKANKSVDGLKDQLAESTARLKVAEATAPKNSKPLVKLGDKYYQVRCGVRGANGNPVSREELAKDTARCEELVASGSTILKEVQTK